LWHFSAVPTPLSDVGYPGHTGKHLLVLSFTGFEPEADMSLRIRVTNVLEGLRAAGE
jgi:hypothetical protein